MITIVKTYLGIDDNLQDALLQQMIDDYTRRVNNYISAETLPTELQWVVRELTIIRYNRIGSEGMQSESEEGKSQTYKDGDPFDSFRDDLDKYLESKQEPAGTGRARFI